VRKYIMHRLLLAIPTLFGVTVITFLIVHLIPGDPITVMFGQFPDPVGIQRLKAYYGLDRPLAVQYFVWLKHMLTGDMGNSIRLNQPIAGMIVERLPRTFTLTIAATLFSFVVSLPAGILSAYRRNSWIDLGITGGSLIGMATPSFWLGILLLILFSVYWPVFPLGGYVEPSQSLSGFLIRLVLPSLTLGLSLAATSSRVLRSAMLEVLRQEFVTVARAKGLTEGTVLLKHSLRNAMIPTVTMVAMQVGYLLGGTVVIERVYAYPGLGLLLLSSVNERDYPLIQAQILVFATFFVLVNLITDLLYTLIDPRVRYQ
jgi:peptide/nickel transport system permease protein